MAQSIAPSTSSIVTLGNSTFIEIDPAHWPGHPLNQPGVSMVAVLTEDQLKFLMHPFEIYLKANAHLGVKISLCNLTESSEIFTCETLLKHQEGAWGTHPVYIIHFNNIHALIHYHEICVVDLEPTSETILVPKRYFCPLLRFCTVDGSIDSNLPAYRLPTKLSNGKFHVIFDLFELSRQGKLPMN